MRNLGYTYYKEYFNQLDLRKFSEDFKTKKITEHNNKELDEINKILFDEGLTDIKYYDSLSSLGLKEQKLTTIYPGLLIGSGYIHEIGGLDNELKLGFFFDHTTGIPIIPASSVKGLLRSAFKKALNTDDSDKKIKASLYVQELLKDITEVEWELKDIYFLEKSIFDGKENASIYKRDIFFDAYPISSKNDGNKFLANDYITPHLEPLKNPIPIQFLKILPQVQFQFNFKLHDFNDENDMDFLSAKDKKELFKHILLDLGIGAKTNVGYGQFVDENSNNEKTTAQPEASINLNPDKNTLIEGDTLKAKITSLHNGFFIDFGFRVGFTTKIIGVSPKAFKLGQIIDVEVVKRGKILSFNIINPST